MFSSKAGSVTGSATPPIYRDAMLNPRLLANFAGVARLLLEGSLDAQPLTLADSRDRVDALLLRGAAASPDAQLQLQFGGLCLLDVEAGKE